MDVTRLQASGLADSITRIKTGRPTITLAWRCRATLHLSHLWGCALGQPVRQASVLVCKGAHVSLHERESHGQCHYQATGKKTKNVTYHQYSCRGMEIKIIDLIWSNLFLHSTLHSINASFINVGWKTFQVTETTLGQGIPPSKMRQWQNGLYWQIFLQQKWHPYIHWNKNLVSQTDCASAAHTIC